MIQFKDYGFMLRRIFFNSLVFTYEKKIINQSKASFFLQTRFIKIKTQLINLTTIKNNLT